MSALEINKTESLINSEVVDNDVHVKLQELSNKLVEIEKENEKIKLEKQKMQESYDIQRGKYSRLFMQKEAEVERLKNELASVQKESSYNENERKDKEQKLKANTEHIAELCQIVHDTLEESSSSQNQVKNLQKAIQSLEDQLAKLTIEKGDSILLAPTNMLLATKSFAKKVVSQLGPDPDKSAEDLEDSMKKAKENADAMRSIVLPLEEQISDLTEKLRIAEEKLKKYEDGTETHKIDRLGWSVDSSRESVEGASPSRSSPCEMCANYEAQLQAQQQQTNKIQKQKEISERNLIKFKEELAKETQFRKEMEDKWSEKKEEQKLQVQQLKAEVIDGKSELLQFTLAFESLRRSVEDKLHQLTFDREKVSSELKKLQAENDNLVGKHSKNSEQLRNEFINFPANVEELQVLLLKNHEDLIQARVAKERLEEQYQIALSEIEGLTKQFETEQNHRRETESELMAARSSMKSELKKLKTERNKLKTDVEALSMQQIRHKAMIGSLQDNLQKLTDENATKTAQAEEYHSQVVCLQEQLDTSEANQKDFVNLTQTLQVKLEEIRGADTEVRWQHEDDVTNCQDCREKFQSSRRKDHCKHCGKIFCPKCLTHTVPSGPQRRILHVCNVCHTLLNRDTAPFFREKPPNTPD